MVQKDVPIRDHGKDPDDDLDDLFDKMDIVIYNLDKFQNDIIAVMDKGKETVDNLFKWAKAAEERITLTEEIVFKFEKELKACRKELASYAKQNAKKTN